MSHPSNLNALPDLHGKRILITGGNRGLGYQIALGLAGAGAELVLACRDPAKAAAAVASLRAAQPTAKVEAMELDVADLASVRRFADAFKARYASLDVLIHNAAAIMVPQGKTKDGFETHLATNHLGPFALTGLLLDSLEAAPAARVVSMASLAHRMTQGLDPEDPGLTRRPYKEMDAYGRSKLAALLFTFELERRLRRAGKRSIAVAAHPGYTATNLDLGNFFMRLSTRLFAQKPEIGALPALMAATGAAVKGGDYYGPGGYKELGGLPKRVDCSAAAKDPELARRLWLVSQQLTGLSYL
jgi:NAD(P)-dependent dehydrogenase (short-subunit alcohol dehydrogenase family)